ncbi:ABC transporter, permease protein [Bacteriovorax sp. Seq25_V]|nr:ABC transporter, permease protein [Bacteriovorax sp. Seq25_V]
MFYENSWFPSEGQFNLVPIIVASVLLSLGAIVIALPLGLFTALFTQFYLGQTSRIAFRKIIELYTGIPSVIFGFWGLVKLVPLINEYRPPGQSMLAGILVLSLMIFPIISLNLISAIEMSSKKVLNVSDALGLSRETYIWKILFPNIKGHFLSSSLIALGRALGETMAVLMVCGNIVQIPGSIFDPIRSLTANIALEMAYATGAHRSALFLSGLVLFLLTLAMFLILKSLKVDNDE